MAERCDERDVDVTAGAAACAALATTVVGAVAWPALVGAGLVAGSLAGDVVGSLAGSLADDVVRRFWP